MSTGQNQMSGAGSVPVQKSSSSLDALLKEQSLFAAALQLEDPDFHVRLGEIIENSSNQTVKSVIQRLLSTIRQLGNTNVEAKIKVSEVYDHYRTIQDLYFQEHVLLQQKLDQIYILESELKKKDELIKNQESRIEELDHCLVQQKEEFTKSALKQGQGRKALEDKLMAKEIQLVDLRKKIQDFDLPRRNKELEGLKLENSSLRALVTLLQGNQISQTSQRPHQHQHH